ncbi:substrate-binding domain-containing protein [Vibrio quintilis]|uniref:Autoinducer 2-binding periplasmic protein LuxP n=1 Tax=Vibrio quintilis TaxID=1117707 RepID=A0A1M7YX43_9VIBR|nr:substrate-binding domain-containing protein [Vibrio quintilis]SHO57280.1 D-ribose-binding periplasmic protein precursor [Vibrio quintilis]
MKFLPIILLFMLSWVPGSYAAKPGKNIPGENCIAMVVSGSDSRQFWSKMINGARLAGKELGIDVFARGTVNDNDTKGQKFILDNLMEKYRCRGVLIAPSDVSRNQDVARLKQQNIPVIYIDRDTGGDRLISVKTDNEVAGALAARKMAEKLGGRGNVLVFRLQKGVVSTDAREAGFVREARKAGLKVMISGYLGTRIGDAKARAGKKMLQTAEVNGIFTPNDTTTIGVLQAREMLNIYRDAIHIGFDQDTYIISALKQGMLHGYIAQLPFDIGYQATYALYQALHGESLKEDIKVKVLYIDQNTIQ